MSAATAAKGIVLYDGLCPLCQRSVRSLKRLDWRHRLHFQDCRDIANLPRTATPLDPARLLDEMHVVTPDRRRVYTGFYAFRWIAWRLPALWGFLPLLYIPGVPWFGRRLYHWIARHRYNLVPCKDGVCTLHRSRESGIGSQKRQRRFFPDP